jgi:regulator of sirC expression with transglutaminase-like and TPR domain
LRSEPDSLPLARAARSPDLRERIRTLVELLDDPSPTVWTQVRRELLRLARPAASALRRACDHPSPLVRSRARALILAHGRGKVLRRLIAFASRREIRLESGLFLLARLEEPQLDIRPCMLQFDALAAEVLRRVESRPPTLDRSLALVAYLSQEIGLRGDSDDYHHPDNIYVHRALERKRGMPLTLAAIYQSVGRRAGIQSALVPLPGHVMLRIRGGGKSALVDVFQGGEQRTERDMLHYLAELKLPFQPSWFRDADDASMFQRQVSNLMNSYSKRGLSREARGLARVITALELRERGQTSSSRALGNST